MVLITLLFSLPQHAENHSTTVSYTAFHNIQYLVRSKYSLTPKKLLQKVFQLILLGFSVLFNILKVYQNRSPGKVFFSRWRPRWPPKLSNGHKSVTTNSNLMILVSIPMFSGARNTFKP